MVHDWLVGPSGGARVLRALHEIWPDAPIFTSVCARERFPEFEGADLRTTWVERLPLARSRHQLFPVARAWAFRDLDLSRFDLVLSASSAEAKYVRAVRHVCYCFTPVRYYWSDYDGYRRRPPFGRVGTLVGRALLPFAIPFLRGMDYRAAQAVDSYVAISETVRGRIRRYYGRESEVVYPPVDVERFRTFPGPGAYYLTVGRHVAYKRMDVIVDAFNALRLPLKVAGTGEETAALRARARSNVQLLGAVRDDELPELYGNAIALVFAADEDFGIVPVEAMAAGRPVVAFGRGGALETVVEGRTGTFFPEQTPESLIDAVRRLRRMDFDPEAIRAHARRFGADRFKREMRERVASAIS